jgi:hypothetical protein
MMSANETAFQFEIEPPNPPNDGLLFVDHSRTDRSGHLGHALVEYAPGKILAFYPNCSDVNEGHNGDGWMEYRRSDDGGRTWSESHPLEYSKRVYDQDVGRSVMCEKAVCTDDGTIVLFNLECGNLPEEDWAWKPLAVPTFLRSTDSGFSWEPPVPMGNEPGRIFDALYHDDTIFVLELCNDSKVHWYGNQPEHHYALYVSSDEGRSFSRRSVPPFEIAGRGYGAMALLHDGSLIAYVYNLADEKRLEYVISRDAGHSWSGLETAFMAKKIRNPQIAAFKDDFVLHGRSGNKGEGWGHFVLYTSGDGIHWDEGHYLKMRQEGWGAYSNNLLVSSPAADAPARLLIQASHAYELSKTNIYHWWLK